jgi:micrococcal nuclease
MPKERGTERLEVATGPPPPPPSGGKCAASYPDECIPPPPPDLDCGQIPYRNFRVLWNVPDPDPHHFDGDRDGIGCES